MTEGKCAIWGTPSQVEPITGDFEIHNSPRAGGKYKISGTAKAVISNGYFNDEKFKLKLTSWLVEERLSGNSLPEIMGYEHFFRRIGERKFISTTERLNRFFKFCAILNIRLGDNFIVSNFEGSETSSSFVLGISYDPKNLEFYAYTECLNSNDWHLFMSMLKELNYIDKSNFLTYQAYLKIDASYNDDQNLDQVFVAMWFDKSTDSVYKNGFRPAILEAGYKPFRVDDKQHNNKIDDEIIAEIRRSKFVIADFTCGFSEDGKALVRGGVYYEAGFAQGLGKTVVWTCRSEIIAHVHFDTRQYNHIVWENAADLKDKLLNRIRATIT